MDAYQEPLSAHNLAVFCMVIALGALVDLGKPAHSPEAMQYYHLGRAALAIDSVLDEQSISGIQALVGLIEANSRNIMLTFVSSMDMALAT